MAVPGYTLCQQGCMGYRKTCEFLSRHGTAFASVNVRAAPAAADRLAGRGARPAPVRARGSDSIHGQDLDELARFVGVAFVRARLDPATLAARISVLPAAATRVARRLPVTVLEGLLPGRSDRAGADLAAHVALIVTAARMPPAAAR
jgi:hypothetical protein